jgi:hypothetical protein
MSTHSWKFFRAGGFDQVTLADGADLKSLRSLDQKLWVALACPVNGIEFDADTLRMIDKDSDGRIRAPEILEAVEWMEKVLKDVGELTKRVDGLPLASLNETTTEGKAVAVTARRVASELADASTSVLKVEHTSKAASIFAAMKFNGDGVLPETSVEDAPEKTVLKSILDTVGGESDASGANGITVAKVDAFVAAAGEYVAWSALAEADPATLLPMGDATAGAAAAIAAVEDKVEDFFTRCELAAFDARSIEQLSRPASDWGAIAARSLHDTDSEIASFPLASIQAGAILPLQVGVNPAWRAKVETLVTDAVTPILGNRETLGREDWNKLKAHVAAHRAWKAACQGEVVASLGLARLREILAGPELERLRSLIAEDEARRPEAQAIEALDRAARYYRDLHVLLDNFVSFRDFYGKRGKAVFQAGTLYLDGRSCELVMKVEDVARHTALASQSQSYLAYCSAVRCGGTERMNIVAAFTGGDSDFLAVGRNGIFYDRKGNDWDATITSVVENPISIRQAFWSPYKKVAKLISEQMERFAAEKNSAIDAQANTAVASGATQVATAPAGAAAPTAAPSAFDVGRFAGIFAAVGLAIGVIGSALAALLGGFLALRLWQMPLAIAGLLLLISGPSMLMAALKLRQRNLAPLLDASGWAINARARINIPFGASLTNVAALPKGSTHTLVDPYQDKKSPLGLIIAVVALICVLAILWDTGLISRWFNSIASARQNAMEAAEASGAEASAAPAAEASAAPAAAEEAPAP